ncbi:hypothetical protein LS71_009205 [Helicobacter jaachi]|uniref:Uncharacterized protein n=1 Tax=Helicobacter jaachi TaxID=1677920 RepID=A0A4U8T513_9HELI|nr:hypothetical protein [Helicobacter jaachi]TLD94649.1 hypothetical protein LS71_009205 [Helicobacter jaachi]
MSYKAFVFACFFIALGVPLAVVSANYIINPYEIFNHHLFLKGINHNQRYEKIQYLKTHHAKYNSYLIGSSKVGFISPSLIESYIPQSHFYNAWASSANILDAQIFVDYLIASHFDVKNLYILIDIERNVYLTDYRIINDAQRMWHYEIAHKDKNAFFTLYLTSFFPKAIWTKLKHFNKPLEQFEDIHTGTWGYTLRKAQREANLALYIQNEPTFHKNIESSIKTLNELETFTKSLDSIFNHCQTLHINCIFVTSPTYYKEANSTTQEVKEQMLKAIADSIPSGFWHFSYKNTITIDEKNYYESTHHIEEIDSLMLARIFHDTKVQIPNDFGIFITKENFAASLEKMRAIEAKYK